MTFDHSRTRPGLALLVTKFTLHGAWWMHMQTRRRKEPESLTDLKSLITLCEKRQKILPYSASKTSRTGKSRFI